MIEKDDQKQIDTGQKWVTWLELKRQLLELARRSNSFPLAADLVTIQL